MNRDDLQSLNHENTNVSINWFQILFWQFILHHLYSFFQIGNSKRTWWYQLKWWWSRRIELWRYNSMFLIFEKWWPVCRFLSRYFIS